MPAKGWISVRSLPSTKKQSVKQTIKQFFKGHKLCSHCNGRGFLVDDSKVLTNEGVDTVRFSGHNCLEKMEELGYLNGETIKRIIETIVYNRQSCNKCHGLGFVTKPRKKGNEGEDS